MSVEDVYDLMGRAQELPYGEARTVLVEDALRRADAAGDEELAFHVRLALTNAYQYGGEPAKALATFSRSLADHDRDPSRFGETHSLLWQMKAVVGSLTKFPDIPLDRAHAVLDDMERRYRAGGHSMQAVYHYRNRVALHIGDGSADEWFAKWRAAERDELSDCEGCDPSGMIHHLAEFGRFEEALEIAAPVLGAELTCSEQPQGVQTSLLPVYLRTGRYAEAADAHRRAYRVHRLHLADLSDIAVHLRFCAMTGNAARGLEILERHLGWLDRAPSPYAAMWFAASGAMVLRRVAESGHAAATVRRPASGDRAAADVPLNELRADLTDLATGLAARFDERNGTSRQGDDIRAALAAEPVVEFLPLAPHHRRPQEAPAPAPAAPPAPVDDIEALDDLDGLLEIADARRVAADMPRTFAAWRRFDVLAERAEPTPLQAARRLDGHGVERAAAGDRPGAVEAWTDAAARFADLADEVRRHRTLARLGEVRVEDGDEGGMADLTAAADFFTANPGEARDTVNTLARLATACMNLDRPGDALAALDRITDGDGTAGREADIGFVRGHALLASGEPDAAVEVFGRTIEAVRAGNEPEMLPPTALMYVQLRARSAPEDGPFPHEEIIGLLDEVLALPDVPASLRAGAHGERGQALMAAERPADAVADLVEAVAGWTAGGLHEQAVQARIDLAIAYLNSGRHLESAEVAEEALPGLGADPGAARRCRLVLAHAQKELGEEGAADTFAALAEDAAEQDMHDAVAHFLEESAEILTSLDRDALAAQRFAEAAEAYGKSGHPYGVVNARRRAAMCWLWSGDAEGAGTAMETARAALADIPDEEHEPTRVWHTALISFDQARLLAQTGDPRSAAVHASSAVDGFRAIGEDDAAEKATAFLAQLKSASGEHPEDGYAGD